MSRSRILGLIGCPKISKTVSRSIRFRNRFPQLAAGLFAPISYRIGDYLTHFATQGDPNPRLIGFFEHKRLPFISFQDGRFWILSVREHHRVAERWLLFCFFSSLQ
jgi:hypothetical protein